MLSATVYADNLRLADSVRGIAGAVVECGVWRGGMIAGIASLLGNDREYFLFDSFEGLPEAQPVDGAAAIRWQQDKAGPTYHDNCTAGEGFARQAMHQADVQRVHLIKGWFNDTIPQFKPPSPIALLRLDGDWYDSTMVCLEYLFPHVAPGGIIILDDYHTWDGCSRALHDYLSRRSSIERISSIARTCYLIKAMEPHKL